MNTKIIILLDICNAQNDFLSFAAAATYLSQHHQYHYNQLSQHINNTNTHVHKPFLYNRPNLNPHLLYNQRFNHLHPQQQQQQQQSQHQHQHHTCSLIIPTNNAVSSTTNNTSTTAVFPLPGSFPWAQTGRGKPRRGMMRRAVFSDLQRKGLERRFQIQKYISKPDRKKLAEKLGLKDSQVILIVPFSKK